MTDCYKHAAGESLPPLDAAVGQSSALILSKQVQFEGLQVELFEDIDDPVATAEKENMMSQMRSAELQLTADLEGTGFEPFEREAVNVAAASDEFESSSVEADNNRYLCLEMHLQSFCHPFSRAMGVTHDTMNPSCQLQHAYSQRTSTKRIAQHWIYFCSS